MQASPTAPLLRQQPEAGAGHWHAALPRRPDAAPAHGAIRLRDIRVTFGRRRHPILEIDALDIAAGQLAAFVGPSGCGKTTLLNVIGGMLTPTIGSVAIDGVPITRPGPNRNVVFQQHSLFNWMSVLDNVAYGPRALGMPSPEAIAASFLQLVGLQDYARAYPVTLSGGMQQRVAIARALATAPDVLLMDEPFGALDAQTRSIMQDELAALRRRLAPTIIFVTHDIDEALLLADRIVVMGVQPGRIKADVTLTDQLPPSAERLQSPELGKLRARLLAEIREESLKAFNR